MAESSSQDLESVDWAATAKLTLARGVASATVWSVVVIIARLLPSGALAGFFMQMVLVIAIGAPLYHLLIRGVRAVLGGLPFVGLICNFMLFATSLIVAAGDPIVFAFNKQFPHILGIADFKFVNLVPSIFVNQ